MVHGSEQDFLGRARFERRVSLTCAGVSLVFPCFETALFLPAVRHAVTGRILGGLPHSGASAC